MSSKSIKIERIVSEEELAVLLAALGVALRPEAGEGLAPDGFRKLKLSIRRDFGQALAKLKITLPRPEGDEGDDDDDEDECIRPDAELEKYSRLKKRMKDSFEAIQADLAEDRLPPEEAVASFLADSDMMVCYPGYGDEFYLDYTKACKALASVWEQRDVPRLKAAAQELADLKRTCHERYK